MNVEFHTCNRNQLYDYSVTPIKNGQIIALADQDGAYYDMKGERRSVAGIHYFDKYADLPELGYIDMLYIVRTDSDTSKIGIYTWDINNKKFSKLANINTDENVKTSKNDAAKIFLTGATTTDDNVGPLSVNSNIYVENGKLKSVKGFEGKASSAGSADSATKAEKDNKGRVIDETYVESVSISGRDVTVVKDGESKITTIPDENTHYETSMVATGSSTNKKNAAAVNGKVHLVLMDDERVKSAIKIVGSGNTQVTSDANGVITIQGEDKDTTYSNATQSASGLMSPDDKKKLDNVAANANNYSLPQATSESLGGVIVGENITVDGGEITITKQNVIDALGYTPGNPEVSSTVTGVKGYKETAYRGGQVSLSYANVGALSEDTLYAKSDTIGGDALKAKTADSATKASSVVDCTDASKTIQVGHSKTSVTKDTLKQLAGYTYDSDGSNVKIVDVSKDVFKSWLGLGDMAYQSSDSYSVAQATSTVLGTVKIGYTQSGKNYPVQLNSSGQMYVNVPWTDTNTQVSVVNNLTSTSTTSALSAYQGKVLDGKISDAAKSAGQAIESSNSAKETAEGVVLFEGVGLNADTSDTGEVAINLNDKISNYSKLKFFGIPCYRIDEVGPSYWPAHNQMFLGEMILRDFNNDYSQLDKDIAHASLISTLDDWLFMDTCWCYTHSTDFPYTITGNVNCGVAINLLTNEMFYSGKRGEYGSSHKLAVTKVIGYK